MSPDPPQCGRHSAPALIDDAMREIFWRVPPDDPASLVRAAAVCKSWRAILHDAAFDGDYRAFHGAPPMMGFLHNKCYTTHCVSRFVSTASFCPLAREHRNWYVLDSRHGRVLFFTPKGPADFVVCEPMNRGRWRIPTDSKYWDILFYAQEGQEEGITWNAAVLCANASCDHLSCHGGPFLVVFVGSYEERGIMFATVYSSETETWSERISVDQPNAIDQAGHTAVIADKVYFSCMMNTRIVEYNVGRQELSVIDTPSQDQAQLLLVAAKDGMLVFAGVRCPRLYVWSMMVGPDGAVAWAQRRVIELQPLLPRINLSRVSVVGFAEGIGVIFLNTFVGLYTLELNELRRKKVYRKTPFQKVMPYMSFYA